MVGVTLVRMGRYCHRCVCVVGHYYVHMQLGIATGVGSMTLILTNQRFCLCVGTLVGAHARVETQGILLPWTPMCGGVGYTDTVETL
jgi:hypothetical protein